MMKRKKTENRTSLINRPCFRFTNRQGLDLEATAHMPDTPSRHCLVMVHGWGTCRMGPQRYFVLLAEQLAEQGIMVVRFDLPGRGESPAPHTTVTIDNMADSVVDCIEHIKKNFEDISRISLCGICSGGNAAILASTETHVHNLILWSTFRFTTEKSGKVKAGRTAHFLNVYVKKLFRASTWQKIFSGGVNFKKIYHVLFGHFKQQPDNPKQTKQPVMEQWAEFNGQVLFVYGEADPEAVDAEQFFRQYCIDNNISADFRTITGSSHNFYRQEWREELFSATTTFLTRQRAAPAGD